MNNQKIFIVSGEASGDLHGGNLVRELLKQSPNSQIQAWGGDAMKLAGAEVLKHYRELAFMGFWEVIKNLPSILSNFKLIKKQIQKFQPDVVVLIDYPGFNLRLLPWLKKQGFRVVYYIAPQAWAWKEGRVKSMAKYIDELLVILPFEESFFSRRGVKATFVGHPLLQVIQEINIEKKNAKQIALLPGSRRQEIEHILPVMLSTVSHFPSYEFVIAGMNHIGEAFYHSIIGDLSVKLRMNDADSVLSESALALVSSGTATLQTALYEVPQIVCYRSGRINYELGKRLIQVPFISLVNLIFGKEVVRELIQHNLSSEQLCDEMNRLLSTNKRAEMIENYQQLRTMLGEKNASKLSADIILAEH